jgi:hypothetical protein
MLMGLTWASAYSGLAIAHPASFRFPTRLIDPQDGDPTALPHFDEFLYFSFVTLTTLGYGDIIPVSSGARNLSALEAVGGQIYLAVLVARLVGLQVVHSARERRDDSQPPDPDP